MARAQIAWKIMAVAHLLRLYTRYSPIAWGKHFVWNALQRHINWRDIRTIATSRFPPRYHVAFPDMIQEYIFYFGVWEPTITEFIIGTLKKNDSFVDIGANIGYYTCLAAEAVGAGGQVHAIEASPSIYRSLCENIALNGYKNVVTLQRAVYSGPATLKIYKAPTTNLGASTTMQDRASERGFAEEAEVAADSLGNLIPLSALLAARIIKIDVEGAEWLVLQGIRDILSLFSEHTDWLIEVSPAAVQAQGGSLEEVVAMFAEAGYQAYCIENKYRVEWYLKRQKRWLSRLSLPVEWQTDILFSKRSMPQFF